VLELKDVPPPPHHVSTASHQLFHLAPPPLPPPDLPTLQLQLPPVPHKHLPCSQLQEGPGPKVSICTWCDHYDAVGYGALAGVCDDCNTGGLVASYASPSTYKAPIAAGCVGPAACAAAPLLNLYPSGSTSEASNALCSPAAYQFPSCVATSQPVSTHSCSACSTGVLNPYSSLSLPCRQASLPPPPPPSSSSPLPLAPRLSSLATLPIPMHVSSGCCCPCGANCGRAAAETQRTVLHGDLPSTSAQNCSHARHLNVDCTVCLKASHYCQQCLLKVSRVTCIHCGFVFFYTSCLYTWFIDMLADIVFFVSC